jgi:nucleoside-diphosphate-sugar epimerase
LEATKGDDMKIFVTGATGALGRRLVPLLVAHGHEVTGSTTTESKLTALGGQGAGGVVLDVLDRNAVITAVMRAEPDVVIHEATALSGLTGSMRGLDRQFALTNRLRTEGTDNLLEAAKAAGAQRFVAQSYAGWPYARKGSMVKDENDPLDDHPLPAMRATLAAIRHLEKVVTNADGIEGVVLRYGGFYGPGTSLADDGVHTEAVRKRRFPIVGGGTGVWSFIHIVDAATATLLAAEHGKPGIYNVVDDDPAPVSEWLPELAAAVGAKPPRRAPVWLGRLLGGEPAAVMMTELRGASNAKAKRDLGWQPLYPSWRQGFRALSEASVPSSRFPVPSS